MKAFKIKKWIPLNPLHWRGRGGFAIKDIHFLILNAFVFYTTGFSENVIFP